MKTTRTVYTCDRCSAEMPHEACFKVQTGFQQGAVSMEAEIRCIDLCHACAIVALQRICNCGQDRFESARKYVEIALNPAPLKRSGLP